MKMFHSLCFYIMMFSHNIETIWMFLFIYIFIAEGLYTQCKFASHVYRFSYIIHILTTQPACSVFSVFTLQLHVCWISLWGQIKVLWIKVLLKLNYLRFLSLFSGANSETIKLFFKPFYNPILGVRRLCFCTDLAPFHAYLATNIKAYIYYRHSSTTNKPVVYYQYWKWENVITGADNVIIHKYEGSSVK